jgi:pimeloyl-ACP methyl ester carboxylesterase
MDVEERPYDASVDGGGDARAPKLPAVVRSIPFGTGRSAYVVLPRDPSRPARLLAMLHGVCVPPSYVCGGWKETAADVGLLVCPTGNTTCGPEGTGGPTWEEPFAAMDMDLEQSIEATRRNVSPRVDRRGAVLGGFSRGAYVAVILAVRHPGRWPYLVLNEADVELTVPMLTNAGVKAVALIAGEWGAQVGGERKTVDALAREGYPARLWVMPKVGHAYSSNIDGIMGEVLEYLLGRDQTEGPP